MIRCRECNGVNSDDSLHCQYCGSNLPPEPIREFLVRNSPMFTIAALFTALTFYLSTLVKDSQATTINGTLSLTPIISSNISQVSLASENLTYSILLQPTTIFQRSPIAPISPDEFLVFALLSSFLILCGIFVILILDLLNSARSNPNISHEFFYLLLVTFILFMIFYFYSMHLVEFTYYIFFGFWILWIFFSVKYAILLTKNKIKHIYLSFFAYLLVAIIILYLVITTGINQISQITDINLKVTIAVGIIGTLIVFAIVYVMVFITLVYSILQKKLSLQIKSDIKKFFVYMAKAPRDFVENCIDILYLR